MTTAAPAPAARHDAALSAADHARGNPQARLTLLQYGDYECPACIAVEPALRALVDRHAPQLRFVYRHHPWVELHPHAELAAEAAEAAAAQGQFWAMHAQLFKAGHHLDLPGLTARAAAIGLDMVRFKAEMADHVYTQRVQEHRRAGVASGLRATPAYFLGGQPVAAAADLAPLEAAIRHALTGH